MKKIWVSDRFAGKRLEVKTGLVRVSQELFSLADKEIIQDLPKTNLKILHTENFILYFYSTSTGLMV